MKNFKWQNRDAKRVKRVKNRKKMIGGKKDLGIMEAQKNRVKPIFFCKKCGDMKLFRQGKCKKCKTPLGRE